MKFTFTNLGLIKKTELDLRPLTVIIGPNNSNKTYLAYSVYGILKLAKNFDVRLHEDETTWFAQVVADRFSNGIGTFFQDSSRQLFSRAKFSLVCSDDEVRNAEPEDAQDFFPDPFLLPAERNALIITYKLLANRRYKLLKDFSRELFREPDALNERQEQLLREQGEVRYPQPVEDFLDLLTDIELEAARPRDPQKTNPFHALADLIEARLHGNNQLRFHPTALGGQEIRVKVSERLEIDLYNASSSIKQVVPLLLYLRFRARKGQLLIIDEPEMNLHPESQSRLLEALAILVNLGVKVLLTTHSPYLLAHLNNLVRPTPQSAAARKRQAQALYLQDPRAFLTEEQVSPYEMRDYKLQTLYDPDYGIRWGSLSDVSEALQETYFKLPELAKGPRRGKKGR